MALPPIHRVDHEPVFISVADDAWDHKRIASEERVIMGTEKPVDGQAAPWESVHDHPMTRYWSGDSRGDLETVRQYLLPDKLPTEIRCRRLILAHWTEAKQLRERRLTVAHQVACVRYGVVGVENGTDADGTKISFGSSPLTDVSIDKLRRLLGDEGFQLLAGFIWRCSEEPSPSEIFT